MISKIVLKQKIKSIAGKPWHPVDVAKVNNQVVRLALFKGEYHWHTHDKEDELFFVVQGKLTIQLKPPRANIVLKKMEMAVVPKGIEHCPKSSVDTYVLMFEPSSLKSKGN